MPYIKQSQKEEVRNIGPTDSGELNYAISMLIKEYWTCHGPRYAAINDIMGALEGAKMEFYRRVVVPYENQKIFDNGDVY